MASKIKINNANGKTLAITNKDTNFNDKEVDIGEIALTRTTVADMIDIVAPSDNDVCVVTDKNQGGTFVYDSSKITEDNKGTNFNGWIRQYSGAVNVKWFGAIGDYYLVDGTVNPTPTDNTLLIQLAINSSTSVDFVDGTYLSSPLTLKQGVEIFSSKNAILKANENNTSPLLSINSVSITVPNISVNIHDLTIDGGYNGINGIATSNDNQYIHSVSISSSVDTKITNVKFIKPRGDCIYLGSSGAGVEAHNYNTKIYGCSFIGDKDNRNGISIIDGTDTYIDNCYFTKLSTSSMIGAIDFEPNTDFFIGKNLNVTNCIFEDNASGQADVFIFSNSVLTHYIEHINISNNEFRNTDNAISLNNDSSALLPKVMATIVNNNCANINNFITLANVSNIKITGNTINTSKNEFIMMGYTSSHACSNILINSNEFYNCTTDAGIQIGNGSADIQIVNNFIDSVYADYIYFIGTISNTRIDIINNIFSDSLGIKTKHSISESISGTHDRKTIKILKNTNLNDLNNNFAALQSDDWYGFNSYTTDSLPSTFPYAEVTSNVNGAYTGNPASLTQGTLITRRTTNAAFGWGYQLFFPRKTVGQTTQQVIYIRTESDTDAWSSWVELVGQAKSIQNLPNLPTTDPAVAGQLWNNAGVVTVSAG